jgi:predicted alpha/beta-hydrolase family hydrolase
MEVLWNRPETTRATLVLAHGAGAPMDSGFMADMAARLGDRGLAVMRFEFPYMARRRETGKKSPPDRSPVLLESFHEQLEALGNSESVFIGGKSLGGRMASMLATEVKVAGVVALGYPFHPPGKPERTRLDHLPDLRAPMLICQGERDPLGHRSEVAGYELPASVQLHWLPDGDHDLKPRKKSGYTHEQNLDDAARAVAAWVADRQAASG